MDSTGVQSWTVFLLSFCTSSSQCHSCTRSRSCTGEEIQKPPSAQPLPLQEREHRKSQQNRRHWVYEVLKCTFALHYLVPQIHPSLAFWFPDILHRSPFSEHTPASMNGPQIPSLTCPKNPNDYLTLLIDEGISCYHQQISNSNLFNESFQLGKLICLKMLPDNSSVRAKSHCLRL